MPSVPFAQGEAAGWHNHSELFDVFRPMLHDSPRIIWFDTSVNTIGRNDNIVAMEFACLRNETGARCELDKVARLFNPLIDEARNRPASHEPTRGLGHTRHAWNLGGISAPDRPSQWVHIDAYWNAEKGRPAISTTPTSVFPIRKCDSELWIPSLCGNNFTAEVGNMPTVLAGSGVVM